MSFAIVVFLTGAVIAWAGIHFIGKGIINEAQRRVEMDLNAARDIYGRELEKIGYIIDFIADRLIVKTDVVSGNSADLYRKLEAVRIENNLDFLTLTDGNGVVVQRSRNPGNFGDSMAEDEIVGAVLRNKIKAASTQSIPREELVRESEKIADQSCIKIAGTPEAGPIEKEFVESGMVLKAASPVMDEHEIVSGVLYGGKLINRNYGIVDKITNVVFQDEVYEGRKIGRATIFLGDVRISTNVENPDGSRAVGTRVSRKVQERVLKEAAPWIDRAYAVGDWYLTAYEPIRNIRNQIIGILGLGIIDKKYIDLKKQTLFIFSLITAASMVISLIVAFMLSQGITGPIRKLVAASKQLADGRLDSRVEPASKDELGELAASFNMMATSLMEREKQLREYTKLGVMRSDKLANLGQLAASVAHEINNPLAVIMGRAEFLAAEIDNDDPIIRKSIETIEKESEKAASTVQRFLAFARRSEPEFKPVAVNRLIENSLELANHLAMMEKITVIKDLGEGIPEISGDPRQLEQVFVNILLNAIQAMRAGGRLNVSSRRKGNSVWIRFADTGCGIPPENMEKIFDPFFTTQKAGTGLGLAICKQTVENHNGAITIESTIGEGTVVIITVPYTEQNTNAE